VTVVGVLHPGEMGAAVAAALRERDETVLWASGGRSAATADRARQAGLEDAGDLAELCRRCDVLVSIVPPHAALDVAREANGFEGIYVDANATAPETARTIAGVHGRFVDGGIVGPPPLEPGRTRLYLSGDEAGEIAELFAGTTVDARVISAEPGAASALKMAYAGWTKASAALLLTQRALARAEGVEDALLEEWRLSLPDLEEEHAAAARSAQRKGWRWIGEMEEIARSMAAHNLPTGFHEAAAQVFRHTPGEES
jgi:3-hydroxyisobutyrate dehydrogenase-like beta-hydroxyacid dehydrogenase